jgi:hypothetical protein
MALSGDPVACPCLVLSRATTVAAARTRPALSPIRCVRRWSPVLRLVSTRGSSSRRGRRSSSRPTAREYVLCIPLRTCRPRLWTTHLLSPLQKLGRKTKVVRDVIREVAGYAPYEKRVMELLKVGKDKRALRVCKSRVRRSPTSWKPSVPRIHSIPWILLRVAPPAASHSVHWLVARLFNVRFYADARWLRANVGNVRDAMGFSMTYL